jgi:hypothetical protein
MLLERLCLASKRTASSRAFLGDRDVASYTAMFVAKTRAIDPYSNCRSTLQGQRRITIS